MVAGHGCFWPCQIDALSSRAKKTLRQYLIATRSELFAVVRDFENPLNIQGAKALWKGLRPL